MSNARNIADITGVTGAGGVWGNKNILINGDMRIAQRGTSSTTDNNYATVDRWFKYCGDTATWGQAEDAVHGKYVYWQSSTSGYGNLRQRVEGMHVPTGGLPMVFSCWMRISSGTAPFRIEVWNLTDNTNIYSNTNVTTITTSWQRVVIPFTLPASASNDVFHVMVGSDNTSTAQAAFNMTKCQLEVGSVATPFEYRPYGAELALCQRYFQRTDTAQGILFGVITTQTGAEYNIRYQTEMRAAPTLSYSSASNLWCYVWSVGGGRTADNAATIFNTSRKCVLSVTFPSPVTTDHIGKGIAMDGINGDFLRFSAEL